VSDIAAEDFAEEPIIGLASWWAAFERQFARAFVPITLPALGVMAGRPEVGIAILIETRRLPTFARWTPPWAARMHG
jgi:hypothetical protein